MAKHLTTTKRLGHDDYTVVCFLPFEKAAAHNMLDELRVAPPQPEHNKTTD
jgi:hypothetical protein